MTQIQPISVCTCPQCCVPPTNNYNGVKIDITNPAVNLPPAATASIYDIPKASIYNPEDKNIEVEEIK